MGELKLGALAPKRPYGLSELSVYAKGKIPSPPPFVPVPAVADWGMFLNDTYGICTLAGVAHEIMAWNVEVNENDPIPTDPQTKTQYFAMTGGADSGLVEADVLKTWYTDGLFGHKIAGYAPVNPHDLTGIHQAVAFYGGAYIGVALPASAQQQFASGQTWTVVPGSPIVGGHCVVICGYSQTSVQIVTWGQVANVSYPWLSRYCTEVWSIIPNQFIEAGHGTTLDVASTIDLASLQSDLARL
jgi:hypothetical protein